MRTLLALSMMLLAAPVAAGPIEIRPLCFIGADQIEIFVLATIRSSASNPTVRNVFSLKCSRKTNQCSGSRLALAGIEQRGAVAFEELLTLEGPTLSKSSADTAIVVWGAWTFTLNMVSGKVTVIGKSADPTKAESGEGSCR